MLERVDIVLDFLTNRRWYYYRGRLGNYVIALDEVTGVEVVLYEEYLRYIVDYIKMQLGEYIHRLFTEEYLDDFGIRLLAGIMLKNINDYILISSIDDENLKKEIGYSILYD
ncbi:MAG: hypothetical protein QXD03_02595 [Candidatus Anstonellales archaeon]